MTKFLNFLYIHFVIMRDPKIIVSEKKAAAAAVLLGDQHVTIIDFCSINHDALLPYL